MKLSLAEVEHIAALARLKLGAEEAEKYSEQLSAILDYMQKLQEVDTENIEPTSQVTGLVNITREDQVDDAGISEELLHCGQQSQNGFIKIPKIFSDR